MNRRLPFLSPLAEFLRAESAGGIVLLGATAVALIWANAAPAGYADIWDEHRLEVVNEGMMTFFFLVVGLEIKRELVCGELRDRRTAALPALAALGGMLVPALLYVAWNAGTDAVNGWGIPMATDIAFAVGVLSLLGARAPSGLKLFVLTLAIVDDIGAILLISLVYSDGVSFVWLALAAAVVASVVGMRAAGVRSALGYLLPAVLLWVCLYEAGVDAAIAGVVLGLLTPARWPHGQPPVERLELLLHPWVSFGVVPLFALANAGVRLSPSALNGALTSRVAWGILTGLVVGKLIGVALATLLGVRLGVGRLPDGVTSRHVLGASALTGIGFTVSLLVATLAFTGDDLAHAKIAVLAASLVAGTLGAVLLGRARRYAPPS